MDRGLAPLRALAAQFPDPPTGDDGQKALYRAVRDAARGMLDRLGRTSERLEGMVRAIQESQGLVPSLLFDPERTKVLDDVQEAAAGLRNLTEDLQTVVSRLRQGEGTLGALLEDPTVYEDLSALLRGANRSLLLRTLIRSTREDGAKEGQK